MPKNATPQRFSNKHTQVSTPRQECARWPRVIVSLRKSSRSATIPPPVREGWGRKYFSAMRGENSGPLARRPSQAQIDCTRSRPTLASPLRTTANFVAIGPIISYSTTAESTIVEMTG